MPLPQHIAPVLYFGDDAFTGYFGWEQLQPLRDQANGATTVTRWGTVVAR